MANADRLSIARLGVVVGAVVIVCGAAAPAAAQNEDALKAFFQGKRVVTRIDMPGTEEGIDVRIGASEPIDSRTYGDRLKDFGAALRAGDTAVVTLVKVKKDLIEFQLSGGGYGTFGDDTSTSVYIPLVQKSEREKELERRVKDEDDDRRRRELRHELDELRERRERENRRIEIERQRASDVKREQIAERRLHGGSRFNIRYRDAVPRDITPDDVMAALTEYVDFSSVGWMASDRTPTMPSSQVAPPEPPDASLRKGMTRDDVERRLGPAQQVSDHHEGSVTVTTVVFFRGDERIVADFIEDVLVRYTISSR